MLDSVWASVLSLLADVVRRDRSDRPRTVMDCITLGDSPAEQRIDASKTKPEAKKERVKVLVIVVVCDSVWFFLAGHISDQPLMTDLGQTNVW